MDELDALKCENKELHLQLDKFSDVLNKCKIELDQTCKTVVERDAKIKFLEGQIEAYQYCMNCRR